MINFRNYIAALNHILNSGSQPSPLEYAHMLCKGMSQTTTNLIASLLQVQPRLLVVAQQRNDLQNQHPPFSFQNMSPNSDSCTSSSYSHVPLGRQYGDYSPANLSCCSSLQSQSSDMSSTTNPDYCQNPEFVQYSALWFSRSIDGFCNRIPSSKLLNPVIQTMQDS